MSISINQSIITALSFYFYKDHRLVQNKLEEYLRSKDIKRNEYDQWAEQIVPIFQQLSQNRLIMNRVKSELDKIRKNKKWNFWMNSGNMKISTIHSFKGWEVDSLFLIIEKELDDSSFYSDELLYTAITRCRRNLFILDLNQFNQSRYYEFFRFAISTK
jgi:superfamily I DNA/RNA helicase